MAIFKHQPTMLFLLSVFMLCFDTSESFIGVTYGQYGYIYPEYEETAKFLTSTYIQKFRTFETNALVARAMGEKGIDVVFSTSDNSNIHILLSNKDATDNWVQKEILPVANYIDILTIGNQVISSGDTQTINDLVPLMELVQEALNKVNLTKIKVSTVHSMAVLSAQEPPSNASFNPAFAATMNPLLRFLREHNSPFMITNYPYYSFQNNPTPENLAFCTFQKNAGRVDPVTGYKYWNMFDWKIDAIRNALDGYQYRDLEIMVAETGWPTWGDNREVGATTENARIYNANLVHHLRTSTGTPMMPNKVVSTYIQSIFDENLKSNNGGLGSDAYWGIVNFKDLTWKYSCGLSKYFYKNTIPPPPPKTH
ncbi:hypothetical protein LguiA_027508 [Lonicera macranthoides]